MRLVVRATLTRSRGYRLSLARPHDALSVVRLSYDAAGNLTLKTAVTSRTLPRKEDDERWLSGQKAGSWSTTGIGVRCARVFLGISRRIMEQHGD